MGGGDAPTPGKDRELNATLLLIDIDWKASRVLGAADNVMVEARVFLARWPWKRQCI